MLKIDAPESLSGSGVALTGQDRAAQPCMQRVSKPWGWELKWTPGELPYVGKVLHIWAGQRLSLQVHESKTESWLVVNGRAMVVWQDATGELVECELVAGRGYTCETGRKHRLVGITDCDIVEVSTPEVGMTWRLEDDYGRGDETEDDRAEPASASPRPSG